MKTAEMEKEAKMFNREKECYIHIQRCNNQPYAQIISGDPVVITQAVYNLMCELETEYGVPFKTQMKILKWSYKNVGLKEHMPISVGCN